MDKQNPLPSASNLFGQSVKWYVSHFPIIFGVTIIPIILSIVGIYINTASASPSLVAGVAAFIFFFITVIAGFLSELGLLAVVAGGSSSVGNAYRKGLPLFWPFIWVSFLVGLTALGGFVLLIIPGIIIGIFLGQSIYVLFTEDRRGISALVKSWHYVKGRAGSVFWRSLFLGIIVLLISLGISFLVGGSALLSQIKNISHPTAIQPAVSKLSQIINTAINQIILIPLGIIYGYLLFSALRATKTEPLDEDREHKLKKKIIIFMIIGIIGFILIPVLLVAWLWAVPHGPSLVPTTLNSLR